MTRKLENPMPAKLRASIAGSANSSEAQRLKGIKGQAVTRERYGGDQLRRAQLKRHYPQIASIAPSKKREPEEA